MQGYLIRFLLSVYRIIGLLFIFSPTPPPLLDPNAPYPYGLLKAVDRGNQQSVTETYYADKDKHLSFFHAVKACNPPRQ